MHSLPGIDRQTKVVIHKNMVGKDTETHRTTEGSVNQTGVISVIFPIL